MPAGNYDDLNLPDPAKSPEPTHSWTMPGVDGKVSFLVNHEICLLHTFDSDDPDPQGWDMFVGRRSRLHGMPVEMNRDQARRFALKILESLEAEVEGTGPYMIDVDRVVDVEPAVSPDPDGSPADG
jgi:hypothetical protein